MHYFKTSGNKRTNATFCGSIKGSICSYGVGHVASSCWSEPFFRHPYFWRLRCSFSPKMTLVSSNPNFFFCRDRVLLPSCRWRVSLEKCSCSFSLQTTAAVQEVLRGAAEEVCIISSLLPLVTILSENAPKGESFKIIFLRRRRCQFRIVMVLGLREFPTLPMFLLDLVRAPEPLDCQLQFHRKSLEHKVRRTWRHTKVSSANFPPSVQTFGALSFAFVLWRMTTRACCRLLRNCNRLSRVHKTTPTIFCCGKTKTLTNWLNVQRRSGCNKIGNTTRDTRNSRCACQWNQTHLFVDRRMDLYTFCHNLCQFWFDGAHKAAADSFHRHANWPVLLKQTMLIVVSALLLVWGVVWSKSTDWMNSPENSYVSLGTVSDGLLCFSSTKWKKTCLCLLAFWWLTTTSCFRMLGTPATRLYTSQAWLSVTIETFRERRRWQSMRCLSGWSVMEEIMSIFAEAASYKPVLLLATEQQKCIKTWNSWWNLQVSPGYTHVCLWAHWWREESASCSRTIVHFSETRFWKVKAECCCLRGHNRKKMRVDSNSGHLICPVSLYVVPWHSSKSKTIQTRIISAKREKVCDVISGAMQNVGGLRQEREERNCVDVQEVSSENVAQWYFWCVSSMHVRRSESVSAESASWGPESIASASQRRRKSSMRDFGTASPIQSAELSIRQKLQTSLLPMTRLHVEMDRPSCEWPHCWPLHPITGRVPAKWSIIISTSDHSTEMLVPRD